MPRGKASVKIENVVASATLNQRPHHLNGLLGNLHSVMLNFENMRQMMLLLGRQDQRI